MTSRSSPLISEAAMSLLAPFPLPEGLDSISYDTTRHGEEIETMVLRSGRKAIRDDYTITDCFSVVYRRVGLFRRKAYRILDGEKLERKRREVIFPRLYQQLLQEPPAPEVVEGEGMRR